MMRVLQKSDRFAALSFKERRRLATAHYDKEKNQKYDNGISVFTAEFSWLSYLHINPHSLLPGAKRYGMGLFQPYGLRGT